MYSVVDNLSCRMYEIFVNRALKVWLRSDRIFRLSSSYQDQKQRQQVIRNFTEKVIILFYTRKNILQSFLQLTDIMGFSKYSW